MKKLEFLPWVEKDYRNLRAFNEALLHVRDRLDEDITTNLEDIKSIEKYYDIPQEVRDEYRPDSQAPAQG